jgi:hypothetical protein
VTYIGECAFDGCNKLPPDTIRRIQLINTSYNSKPVSPNYYEPAQNIIFYGVPGSGKSRSIKNKIGAVLEYDDNDV